MQPQLLAVSKMKLLAVNCGREHGAAVYVPVSRSVNVPVSWSVYVSVSWSVDVQVSLSVDVQVSLSVYAQVSWSVYAQVSWSVYVQVSWSAVPVFSVPALHSAVSSLILVSLVPTAAAATTGTHAPLCLPPPAPPLP